MAADGGRGGAGLSWGRGARRPSTAARVRFGGMDALPSTRRDTFLSFQPPAVGEEEIAAVAETLRSGWLTSASTV